MAQYSEDFENEVMNFSSRISYNSEEIIRRACLKSEDLSIKQKLELTSELERIDKLVHELTYLV